MKLKKTILLVLCTALLMPAGSLMAQNKVVRHPATGQKAKTSTSTGKTAGSALTGEKKRIIDNLVSNMVKVVGGTFTMGGTSEQGNDVFDNERNTRQVTVGTFRIGRYEVTQREWKAVMNTNPSAHKGDNLPVENMTWNECQTFIKKLNRLTGRRFRLPSEAEWEYAARGGNQSRGYKYAGSNNIDAVGWWGDNAGGAPHAVGSKQPNELGLYDMCGNVWEWCQTRMENLDDCRCTRGGSFYNTADYCRVSTRGMWGQHTRDGFLGLRLAL